MDKAPGRELEKRLQDVPRDKIRAIVDQVARAAIFLREKGLCHRDIKSANVFISDDFSKATLLDLSVLRSVDDPIGLGTDHGNQLPVVATSRYSPPEYLFRLIEAGRDLWHALDVYQLGGLLHDLIMREPMFETEYRISKDSNRYRFAWIVATQDPLVAASDVDQDLVQLARRALDKDWERRSALRLDDFLNEDRVRREHALEALGGRARDRAPPAKFNQTRELEGAAREVEEFIRAALSVDGITVVHAVEKTGKSNSRKIAFLWGQDKTASSNVLSRVEFAVTLSVISRTGGMAFSSVLSLKATLEGDAKETDLELPDQKIGPDAAVAIGSAAAAAMPGMAAKLLEVG
jgi:serine/threonine protein kinase